MFNVMLSLTGQELGAKTLPAVLRHARGITFEFGGVLKKDCQTIQQAFFSLKREEVLL